jgi:hypothetical protein
VKGVLADVNIEGYVDLLVALMQLDPWKLFWDHLQLRYFRFASVGLAPDSPDAVVWKTCQQLELFLITDNRNQDGPDSLESTIRVHNTATSLPVFTIADVQRLRHGRDYADQVIESFLKYLLQAENIRGSGRLFLP